MYSWLVDLHLEEYLPLFLSAGYDMRTVSKMTPEVSYYILFLLHTYKYYGKIIVVIYNYSYYRI